MISQNRLFDNTKSILWYHKVIKIVVTKSSLWYHKIFVISISHNRHIKWNDTPWLYNLPTLDMSVAGLSIPEITRATKDILMKLPSTYELPHDKTNKMVCAPSEDSDQPGHPPSLIRVITVRLKKAWVFSYPLATHWAKTLVRLGGCPGWSVFSGVQSFCWFCHEAAHMGSYYYN